jgi:hypothetical protein
MSSRWHATSSVHLSERDYDIQCDDLSDLLSVKDFKETCSELYQEILATHVTHDTPSGGHVTGHTQDMESEITEACKSVFVKVTQNIINLHSFSLIQYSIITAPWRSGSLPERKEVECFEKHAAAVPCSRRRSEGLL